MAERARRAALGLCLAASACASGRAATPASTTVGPRAVVVHPRIDERPPGFFRDPLRLAKLWLAIPKLHDIAAAAVKDEAVPGVAVALVVDDRLVWAEGFGVQDLESRAPVTTKSVFGIGSITKPITALAVLRLRDEGLLALDAPAATYVPEIAGVGLPRADLRGPTIRELLTHTSGLPRLGDFTYSTPPHEPSEQEILASLADYALWHEPGTHMYSNLGYHLLGIVAAHVGKEPVRVQVSQRILAPIGIAHSWWDHAAVPEDVRTAPHAIEHGEIVAKPPWIHGAAAGAGALLLDIEGMAALARFELAAYAGGVDGAPVRAASVRESHVGVLVGLEAEYDGGTLSGRAMGYGFGWSVRHDCSGQRVVSHNGGTEGYASSIVLLPDHGVGLVLLSNLADWPRQATVNRLLGALRKSGGLVEREPVAAPELIVAGDRWAALLGKWDDAAFRESWAPHEHGEDRVADHQRRYAAIAAMAGACGPPELESARHPFVGDFLLVCERADVHVRISATPASGGKVLSAAPRLVGVSPIPELRSAAEATLALTAAWDDATFTARFAPAFVLESTRKEFRERGRKWGTCTLGDVTEVRPQGATWNASCERAEIEVSVGSDRDDHRITVVDARAKDPDHKECK